ncbi:ABC transporter permease [Halomonas sp. PAMB 3264]|uniref:ABC transporter permease n=1 Tax=Halomonas sp. PAMB 3264 TaxID=3075222 RepID=UPI00289CB5CA|nr:ABC transporter permease [Halomonas sp. PAMB 3264]WNL41643.1 ABC transporter permease [Halomonas sp. PAMB 3264]
MSSTLPLWRHERFRNICIPSVIAVLLLIIWQAVVVMSEVPEYLFPSPLSVTKTLIEDWQLLGSSLMNTLKITLISFLLAIITGVLVAFMFVQSRMIERAFFPYAVLLQVTPVVAIAPLIIIWIQNTTLALVVCSSLVALFPIISNTTLGLRSVSPNLLAYFRLRRASRWQTLWRLRVPSALPYFFAALRIASGLALIGAVVAEFVAGTGGANTGLAYQILQSGYQLNIPRMFASLVLISLTGVVLFTTMSVLSKLAIGHWHESEA